MTPAAKDEPVRIGVSSCLLGEQVRYDGGHKRDAYVSDVLSRHFEFVSVCPELEAGMGVPRETLRLVREGDELRMLGAKSATDHTATMRRWAHSRARALQKLGLCGYILKRGSPSCGMERVRTYTGAGMPAGGGRGLFASALIDSQPLLPVEEEGRLCDPVLRENFIGRVFAYRRLRTLFAGRWRVGDLVEFHSREKLLLMAHDPKGLTALGRIVGSAKTTPRAEVSETYSRLYMTVLAKHATVGRHVNVFEHMAGYFRKLLGARERQHLAESVSDYRSANVPLIVPITLFRHYVRLHEIEYLDKQSYLEPHPKELALRNHV